MVDPRYDAICDCFPIEDGHAQERSAIGDVLETVRRNQLWVADRNFCTLKLLYRVDARSAVFTVRHHDKLIGGARGPLRKIGETDTGTVLEQSFVLPDCEGRSQTVRRIVVQLNTPTRNGDAEIDILTNLPADRADRADTIRIAEVYRGRWRIETAFQHLTDVLQCEIDGLCYPQAALFCFANALVAWNAFAIPKAAIEAVHGREVVATLSRHRMEIEMSDTADGMLIASPPREWACFADLTMSEFAASLREVAARMRPGEYRKRAVHVST